MTEPISRCIDFFNKLLVSNLPWYIQDSTHVLNTFSNTDEVTSCFLVTMDVEALYTNINHKQGPHGLPHYLNRCPAGSIPPTDFKLRLTEWTLKNNIFPFQECLFQQQKRTPMGACYGPSLANLFMGLDDLKFIFSGTEQELLSLHGYLNTTNGNLKLSLTDRNILQIAFIPQHLKRTFHTDIFNILRAFVIKSQNNK